MGEASDFDVPEDWSSMPPEEQIEYFAKIGSWTQVQYMIRSVNLTLGHGQLGNLLARAYEVGADKLANFEESPDLPEVNGKIPEYQARWRERAVKARQAVGREDLVNLVNLWKT